VGPPPSSLFGRLYLRCRVAGGQFSDSAHRRSTVLARGTYVTVVARPLVSTSTFRLQLNQRPDNQRDALNEIIDAFWPLYPAVSDKERELYQQAGGNKAKATQLQFCTGAAPEGDAELEELIKQMTAGTTNPALAYFNSLKGYRTPSPGMPTGAAYAAHISSTVDFICDNLVREINRSPANLYIGSSRSNSAIQDYFDAHVPMDPAVLQEVSATPHSVAIWQAEHAFCKKVGKAPSSPIRQTDAGTNAPSYGTSSINPQPGQMGFNYPPANPSGGFFRL
jgi:hypothetical protein